MFAYLFERFPKFSQTFCYREIEELFRQGERPPIFSLRAADLGPAQDWDPEILAAVHYLPEGDEFARAADAAAGSLHRQARGILRDWRGRPDSLRLHQAVYLGHRLREQSIAHLHTHFAGMGARTAYWISRFFGTDFSLTVHANDIFAPRPFEIDLSRILERARSVVAVSDFAADYLKRKFPEARVVRVYNGIDLEQFAAGVPASPALILSVGRLIPKKGFATLIDAVALLRDRGQDLRLQIIGDGPERGALASLIQQRKLEAFVSLPGEKSQPEVRALLSQATLFVLLARVDADGGMDNLPTVIMEAMASALPVVSTSVAGIPEMVEENVTGNLVPPDDPFAAAAAIESFLANPGKARAAGERGRERAREKFSIATNVALLRRLFS